jgi:predicted O-methyltransferase YrrM
MDYWKIQEYLETLVPARHPELVRMEEEARLHDFPIIGPACGQFCYLTARLMDARRIFELGSGYGYSTAWFAKAVKENGGGEVHHVVWDDDLSRRAFAHLQALDLEHLVRFHVGEAVAALDGAEGPFDLIFMDIDKQGYPAALPVIQRQLRPGGVLMVDNLLWDGRAHDLDNEEAETVAIRRFTQQIATDPAWSISISPLRDGVMVARYNG